MQIASLPQDVQNIIQKLISKTSLKCIILYGSMAKGKFNEDSDVDIAACYDHKMSFDEYNQILQELSQITVRLIDFVDLYSVHPPLSQEIFKSGLWIKKDSTVLSQIISRTLLEEKDFLPLKLKIQKEQLKRFIK